MTPRKAAPAREAKTVFFCAECGNESPKWFGRCPHCDAWNSAREGPGRREAAPARRSNYASSDAASAPVKLDEIDSGAEARWVSGIGELDRVLGGGLVPGSLVLIGGDPGIGKSTLALQLAAALGRAERSVLYVSGEESPRQVKLRAERLALRGGLDRLWMQSEIDLERILEEVARLSPSLLVVDSIQTLYLGSLDAAPGSVSQVRECGLRLLRLAKERGLPVLLIGHVTKDGSVAGPRTLEHMVDAVLYLEGERHHEYRILGAAKNRFGSTHEIGVFTMQGDGLAEVENPSERLLKDRGESVPGSAVVATIEGSRPLLVEVQALVAPTHFANPQRVAQGIDARRLAVVIAVLEKRAGLSLAGADVFVNVAGGIRLEEPAADLGLALALASSFRDRPLRPDLVAIGEVGLGGELRPVPQLERRLAEARRLGFRAAIVPKRSAPEGVTGALGAASLHEAIGRVLDPDHGR
ncbi:MAG TPA: DNA repair protein RadA [Candidatus Eisenbacteria bacterium]|jgi:DNA repair protein RadA/Sms|nr:DNA repair protein RadA [Candidatus Eisenbacteria bacterium]